MREDNKFWGKPCRHGHVNEEGKTLRLISNKLCATCQSNWLKRYRSSDTKYKEYQAEYHKKLREEKPYKLQEYRETQVERGHDNSKYYVRKRKQPDDAPADS